MQIGFTELIVIALVALVFISPQRGRELIHAIGRLLKEVKAASSDITEDIRENVIQPVNDIREPLQSAVHGIANPCSAQERESPPLQPTPKGPEETREGGA